MAKSGKLPKAWKPSAAFQIVRTDLLERISSEIALPSPTYSVNRMRSGIAQKRELTEVLRPFVRFTTSSPEAETVKRSPPWNPSSLIKPSMNAIDLPSGDHRGTAT